MIKFLDLHKVNARFVPEYEEVLRSTVQNSSYILGDALKSFEKEFATYCGADYSLGVGNGLDALTLILKGYIHIGRLKEGDEVIVPANTFVATILSVLHAGLQPIFVEPNYLTYNLDAEAVMPKMTPSVKAIIMVHLYGQLADAVGLRDLAEKFNVLLIEDAAQAHGACLTTGQRAGNLGDAAAFSFYPSKNLGALGDGGAITTNDEALYETVALLRNYGSQEKYKNDVIGFNSRLDDLQAAFLSIKLKCLDEDNDQRRRIAQTYLKGITNPKIKLPQYSGAKDHVFYAFVVEVEDRNDLLRYLDNHAIQYVIHYPIPPHKQLALKWFSNFHLPITEEIHKRIVSLPMSPVMTTDEVETVIKLINAY